MSRRISRVKSIGPSILFMLVLLHPLTSQSPATLRLIPIMTYGVDMPASAELGSAGPVAESRNGTVFVLDAVNSKVVAFKAGGAFLRSFGREGEGPGEFRRPSGFRIGDDGALYIWDPGLKRVTRFDETGKNLSQVTLPLVPIVVSFAITNGKAWFVRSVFKVGGAAARAFDLTTGAPVDSFAPLNAAESSLSSYGAPGSIASNKAGEVILAGPFPVDLRIWSGGKVRTIGSSRFPDARGIESKEGVRDTPVSMRGIAAMSDGGYAAVYSTSDRSSADFSAPLHWWLEILGPSGASKGKVELKVERVGGIAATANGDLLLSVTDDVPQVRRVRVEYGSPH